MTDTEMLKYITKLPKSTLLSLLWEILKEYSQLKGQLKDGIEKEMKSHE